MTSNSTKDKLMAFGNFVESDATSGVWRTIPFDGSAAVKLYFSNDPPIEIERPVSLVWRGVATDKIIHDFFGNLRAFKWGTFTHRGEKAVVNGSLGGDPVEFWATVDEKRSRLTPEIGFRLDAKYIYDERFIAAAAKFFQKTFVNRRLELDEFKTLLAEIKSAIAGSYPDLESELGDPS